MSKLNITTEAAPYTSQVRDTPRGKVGGVEYVRMAGPDVAACLFAHGFVAVMRHYGIETIPGEQVYAVDAPYGNRAPVWGIQVKRSAWDAIHAPKVEPKAAPAVSDHDRTVGMAWAAEVKAGRMTRDAAEAGLAEFPDALAVMVEELTPKAGKAAPMPPKASAAPMPPTAPAAAPKASRGGPGLPRGRRALAA